MAGRRNRHGWTAMNAEGKKREVRATLFAKRWTFQSRLPRDEEWTTHEEPELADLEALYEVLYNKYQRKHMSWDTLHGVEQMVLDRGGSIDD